MDDVWSKLYVNVVFNATCAITGYRSGDIGAFAESKAWATRLAQETLAVIESLGVQLQFPDPIEKLWQVSAGAGQAKTSMLQDIENGRRT